MNKPDSTGEQIEMDSPNITIEPHTTAKPGSRPCAADAEQGRGTRRR